MLEPRPSHSHFGYYPRNRRLHIRNAQSLRAGRNERRRRAFGVLPAREGMGDLGLVRFLSAYYQYPAFRHRLFLFGEKGSGRFHDVDRRIFGASHAAQRRVFFARIWGRYGGRAHHARFIRRGRRRYFFGRFACHHAQKLRNFGRNDHSRKHYQ